MHCARVHLNGLRGYRNDDSACLEVYWRLKSPEMLASEIVSCALAPVGDGTALRTCMV